MVKRTRSERRRRAELVEGWISDHGAVCPGWSRSEHASSDLVAVAGRVLCRSCAGVKSVDDSRDAEIARLEALVASLRAQLAAGEPDPLPVHVLVDDEPPGMWKEIE